MASRLYDETLEQLQLMYARPQKLTIGFRATYHAMPEAVAACRRMSPTCDHWELMGRYRRGFSPFDCPNLPADDVVTYPLCHYTRPGKSFWHPVVQRQLSIVWRGQEGFIELQTTQGPECLQQIADAAGVEIEIWNGPLGTVHRLSRPVPCKQVAIDLNILVVGNVKVDGSLDQIPTTHRAKLATLMTHHFQRFDKASFLAA
ncbi:MAG: hypothetical protein ACK5Q5_18870 [Planctomycetaceae bacterium]